MARKTARYACKTCGYTSSKWLGKCPSCHEFNTFEEEVESSKVTPTLERHGYAGAGSSKVFTLNSVEEMRTHNFSTGIHELDTVLGSGFVLGGTYLIAGFPGAGKSTLLLQSACRVEEKTLYCCGEEPLEELRKRAQRLGLPTEKLRVTSTNDVTQIEHLVKEEKPKLVLVDSIASMYHPACDGAPGKVKQLTECTTFLNRLAKSTKTTFVLIGHMSKSEDIAGPMVVMHIVDAVFVLSSTNDGRFRVLRPNKNRFGSTSEVGIFEMSGRGMTSVENPAMIFLNPGMEDVTGNVITPLWEGSRTILVEVQALLDEASGNPRRVSVGLDDKRVAMLMAIINRHGNIKTHGYDVYANIAGGLKANDTSTDMSLILAAMSSLCDVTIPRSVIAFGEVGLSGEVRPCSYGEERLKEALRLGFKTAIIPAGNFSIHSKNLEGLTLKTVVNISTLPKILEEL